MSGESTQDTGTAGERWEDKPNRHAYCDAEIARLRRRADRAEAERDALKAGIAAAIQQIRAWIDPDDPGPLFAPGHAAEVDRTLKKYIGEHTIAALGQPPAEKDEEDPNPDGPEVVSVRPGETPREITDTHLPGDDDA